MEWVVWLVLFAIAGSFQLFSVFTGNKWGQLTNSVRWLRTRLWGRILVFPLWAWLTAHWFVVDQIPGEPILWYPVAIAGGLVLALWMDHKDYYDRGFDSD